MSRLRLFLAWMIMAAIPLQGFAAASMFFCKGDHHTQASSQAAVPSLAAAAGAHDHATHSHPAGLEATKAADQAADAELPDAAHKCGACASCCHSLAIAGFPQWPAFAPFPQAGLAEPFLLIHAAPSQVPDRPPRT